MSLNRDKLSLLRAIADGDVFHNAAGRLVRQFSDCRKGGVAESKISELQAAGLIDDELKLTEAGREADASGIPPRAPSSPPRRARVAAHGTQSGYTRHLRHREEPCAACRDARNLADRTRRQAEPTPHLVSEEQR